MAIIAALTKSCAKSCSGGVARAWVANVQDIASFTFDSDDQITAITMVATKVFYAMDFKRGTKGLIETPTVGDDGCIASVQQVFQGSAQCRDQDSRNWLISAIKQSCCGLVLAIEEENGFVSISGISESDCLPALKSPAKPILCCLKILCIVFNFKKGALLPPSSLSHQKKYRFMLVR